MGGVTIEEHWDQLSCIKVDATAQVRPARLLIHGHWQGSLSVAQSSADALCVCQMSSSCARSITLHHWQPPLQPAQLALITLPPLFSALSGQAHCAAAVHLEQRPPFLCGAACSIQRVAVGLMSRATRPVRKRQQARQSHDWRQGQLAEARRGVHLVPVVSKAR